MHQFFFIGAIVLVSFLAMNDSFGHQGEEHFKGDKKNQTSLGSPTSLERIARNYRKLVEPIIKKKCFDCHSKGGELPWYASIPGPKQLIQNDISDALTHLDMSNGFPFGGHGTPEQDLRAVRESINEGDMPPVRYVLLHWGSRLTPTEIKAVNDWVSTSLDLLGKEQQKK